MHRPPSGLAAIDDATSALSCRLELGHGIGALVRTLAGTKIGGVFLQLGSGAPEAGAWLLDGMDITSRLVVVADEPCLIPVITDTLGNDIRVAVHSQETLEFLHDIRSHELHMVLFDSAPNDEEVVRAAVKLLAPGGILLSLTSNDPTGDTLDLYEWLRYDQSLLSVQLLGTMLLATRRPLVARQARRGARRMRRRRAAQNPEGST